MVIIVKYYCFRRPVPVQVLLGQPIQDKMCPIYFRGVQPGALPVFSVLEEYLLYRSLKWI